MEFTSKENLNIPSTVPRQKIATSLKSADWCKENALYWENRLINKNTYAESDKINMKRNSDMYYYGILDPLEVGKICNPYNLKDFKVPLDFKHYKIENPKVQTLKGEEIKRRFEWKVFVSNRDAVSQKEEQKKDQYFQFITEQINATSFNEEEAQKKLAKLSEYLNYDWQEIRELTADQLLHHYYQYLDLKTEFSKAWEYGILSGEEIMSIDEHNGRPKVEACDSQTMYWLKGPEQRYIDDSDAVVRCYYVPLGQVIDYYYDYLRPDQINDLERRQSERTEYQDFTLNQYYKKDEETGFFIPNKETGDLMIANSNFDGYYDSEGNIRIVHTRWKSLRKVGEVTYFDDAGDAQTKFVDENYKIDETLGEDVKWLWVNEAWEVTRIGEDIFIKGKPRSVQFRKLDDPSYCSLGYVGTKLETCMFDIMKDYSIKYDAYFWRTEQAMIKAMGKIGKLDLALIPDDWDIDMWMHFATNMGWAVIDSFKEGKKGAAQGKLAGSGGTTGDVINMEQGQFIQQNMLMMQYLEAQLDKIIGINGQRQGMLSADAGLQVTREAQEASANITESYFTIHDNVKLRTLRALLEVAKYCLKEKKEAIQYITSEMTSKIFEVDGDLINEADYGILVGDATNDARTITTLQEAVKIALQTGQVDLIQMMDIFSTDSTASIKRKIEKSVREKQQMEQENVKAEQEAQKAQMEQLAQQHQELLADNEADRELERYKIDTDYQRAIDVAQINALGFAEDTDVNDNMIPDVIEQGKLALQNQKLASESFEKQQKLMFEKETKTRELDMKEKETKEKSRLEDKKIKAIEIQNKSQEKMQERQLKMKEKEIASKERIAKSKPKVKK